MQHPAHYHAALRDATRNVDVGAAAGEQPGAPGPLLLDLPDHVLLQLLRRVDVFTLCMLSQTCRHLHHLTSTPLLWPGRRLGGPLVRAVRYSLSSVLHLPPQIFNVRLEESRSSKFPVSVPLHNLRFVMAAGDVEGLAERVSSALQDRIARCPAAALYRPGSACWPNSHRKAGAGTIVQTPWQEQEPGFVATPGGGEGRRAGGGAGANELQGGGGPAALPASAALLLSRADRGFVRLGLRPGVAVAMALRATEAAAAVPLTAGPQPWGNLVTSDARALAPEGDLPEGRAGTQGNGAGAGKVGSSCPWLDQLGKLLDTCWAGVGRQGMPRQGAAGGVRAGAGDLAPMGAGANAFSAGAAEAAAAADAAAAAAAAAAEVGVLRLLDGEAAGVPYCKAAWRAFGNGCMQVASERLSAAVGPVTHRAPGGAAGGHSKSSTHADTHPVAHPLPHVTTEEDTTSDVEVAGGTCTQPHLHRHGMCHTLSPLLLAPGPAPPSASWLVACTSLRLRLLALLTHASAKTRGGSAGVTAAGSSFVPAPPLLPPPPPPQQQLVAPGRGAAGLQGAHAHSVGGGVQAGPVAAAAAAAGGGSAGSGVDDSDGADGPSVSGPELDRLLASTRTVTIAYGSLVASLVAVRQHAFATLQQYQAVGKPGAVVGLGEPQQLGAAVRQQAGGHAGGGLGLYDTWMYDAATEANSADANMCLATLEACLEVRASLAGQQGAPPAPVPGSSALGARPGCILGDPGTVAFGASLGAYVYPESSVPTRGPCGPQLTRGPHGQAAGGGGSGGGGGGSSFGGDAALGSLGLDARFANPRAVAGSGEQLWGGHGGGAGRQFGGALDGAAAAAGMMSRLGLQPTDRVMGSRAAGVAGDAHTRGAAGLCGRPVPTRDAVQRVYGLLSDTLVPAVVRLLASPQSHAGPLGVAPGVQRQERPAEWEEQRMGVALGRALAAGGWEAGAGAEEGQRDVLRVLLMGYLLRWMTWALWVVGAI